MTFRQTMRFTATDVAGLKNELNTFMSLLQSGGLVQFGLKLDDTTRTTAPAAAPIAGSPNLCVVNNAGVKTLMIYDGSAWVSVGSQP